MSDIPLARDILRDAITDIDKLTKEQLAVEMMNALALMHRAEYARNRAPNQRVTMNARIAREVRKYAKANPKMTLEEIGAIFNIAGGRVSEALHGRW